MKRELLAGALAWFDEPLDALEKTIRSLAGVIDVLVPLDGRWVGFADDQPASSPVDQRELVLDLAAELDLRFATIHAPPRHTPFGSQVEKRAMLYSLASIAADWVLVIDADEHVEHAAHDLRATLAETAELGALIGCRTKDGPQAPAGTVAIPRLFCTLDGGVTVEHAHNGVRTGGGTWLAGDPAFVALGDRRDLSSSLRIFHEQGAGRPKERELADRAYRLDRVKRSVERWPAGIPA